MACFGDINVSQGSVATYARCGGTFNVHLTANLPRNLPLKIFQSVKIWQNYGHESVAPFFGPPCICSRRPSVDRHMPVWKRQDGSIDLVFGMEAYFLLCYKEIEVAYVQK